MGSFRIHELLCRYATIFSSERELMAKQVKLGKLKTKEGQVVIAESAAELKKQTGVRHIFSLLQGDLYVDGSCSWPTHRDAARAGWAAVQLNEEGEVVAVGMGTVAGHFQQQSTIGEQLGLLMGAGEAEHGVNIQSDCAGVIAQHRKPYQVAAGAKTKFAGFRKERAIALGTRGQKHGLAKVKAHRSAKEAESLTTEEYRHWRGNDSADAAAKEAVKMHNTPEATCHAMSKATAW